MRHDECCLLFAKRDEDTRKRIAEALVCAEGNGFYTGTCDTSTDDLMKIMERFSKKKLADAGISDQVP